MAHLTTPLSLSFAALCFLALSHHGHAADNVVVEPGHIKVVIVGAGAAGISAAQKLLEKGVDVTVLEASEQIGGRIFSINLEDGLAPGHKGWVEAGAQYIYSAGEFPDWLEQRGYLQSLPEQHDVYFSDARGQLEGETAATVKQLDGAFNELVSPMEDKSFPKKDKVKYSVGEFLATSHNTLVDNDQLAGIDKDLIAASYDINVRGHKIALGVDSLYDVAIDTYSVLQMGSVELKQLNAPFSAVFKDFASNVPEKNILLNKAVTAIKFDKKTKSDHPVSVITSDGAKIAAHHVIFTGSLGVLKADHATLFKPMLSPNRIKAINSVGFGKAEKIFAVYEKPWWKEIQADITGLGLLWEKDVAGKLDTHCRYVGKRWYRSIESVGVAAFADNILEIAVVGEIVESKELRDEKQLAEDLTNLLKKFTKLKDIPQPQSVTVTSWWANPFTRGSKSYISYKSIADKASFKNLSKSSWEYEHQGLKVPALLFAGEATHSEYFSTVQGAIESGWREAKRLIKAYSL